MSSLTSTETVDRDEVRVHDVAGAGGLEPNSNVSLLLTLK